MAKDPAVLFYYQDFLLGTYFMTDAETGAYIRLLCHQADRGYLTEEEVKAICVQTGFTEKIKSKFTIDSNGNYVNKRMLREKEKRSNYVNSRNNNLNSKKSSPHMDSHMENRNRNRNENININDSTVTGTVLPPKSDFDANKCFERVWLKYPNRSGKKHAKRHFLASVNSEKDVERLELALANYLKSERVKNGYIKNGSTFFNEWEDWLEPTVEMETGAKKNGTISNSPPNQTYKCPACGKDEKISNRNSHRYVCTNQEYWFEQDEKNAHNRGCGVK